MDPLHVAADHLRLKLAERADLDTTADVEVDEADQSLVIRTSNPQTMMRFAPLRFMGFTVRVRAAAAPQGQVLLPAPVRPTAVAVQGELLPARRPPQGMIRAEAAPLAFQAEDDRLWNAIEGIGDPLGGMDFDTAVREAPVRVEALVHQRIHTAFHAVYGLGPGGMGPGGMGGLQAETYRLRNRTLREVHGRITAANLADSLHLNWEDYSGLMVMQRRQAEQMGQGRAFTRFFAAHLDNLRRAFVESRAIALRASTLCPDEVDAEGWRRVASAMRAMGEFTLDLLSGAPLPPELPGGARPAIGAPRRQIGGE
jgi:hypothetical protein